MTVKNHLKLCLMLSGVIVVVALVMTILGSGMRLGLDFTGGVMLKYQVGEAFSTDVVRDALSAQGVADAQISAAGANGTQLQICMQDIPNRQDVQTALEAKLREAYPTITYLSQDFVGAVASQNLVRNAVLALVIACALMLVYIALRFDLRSGITAVLGMVYVVVMMCSFMVILRGAAQVNSPFIAALLTMVGYAIIQTLVIFDRIRENNKKRRDGASTEDVVNLSVGECLSRTISATVTTLIVVVCLLVLGVGAIREFALPLMVGLVAGTVFANMISGYVWAYLVGRRQKNAGDQAQQA